MSDPWRIAFIVLQIVFTISLSVFVALLRTLSKDVQNLFGRIEMEVSIRDRKIAEVEKRFSIKEAVFEEKFKTITAHIDRGFTSIDKSIEKLSLKVEKLAEEGR